MSVGYESVASKLPFANRVSLLACDSNGLFAVDKPCGVLSHPNKESESGKGLFVGSYDLVRESYSVDVDGIAREAFLLNRLDSATSGVLLLALDVGVRDVALAAFASRAVEKDYVALAFGSLRGGSKLWKDALRKGKEDGGVRSRRGSGALAETRLVLVKRIPGPPLLSRLHLQPLTGRTHQIRVQAASRGVPIVGDRTYGDFRKNKAFAKTKGMKRLCLHCEGVRLDYSFRGSAFRFEARSECPF